MESVEDRIEVGDILNNVTGKLDYLVTSMIQATGTSQETNLSGLGSILDEINDQIKEASKLIH